jgi:hypothetical protein
MPAPSDLANRLAEDLMEVGTALGFKSYKEELSGELSRLKIDVVWKVEIPALAGSPYLPQEITVVSIEIQISKSDASISHGLLKGLYKNSPYHLVVCQYKLEQYLKDILKNAKPKGLIILDGDQFINLQMWIQYKLSKKHEFQRLERKSIEDIYRSMKDQPEELEENIREAVKEEIEMMFTPKRLKEMLDAVDPAHFSKSEVIADSLNSVINIMKSLMSEYEITSSIVMSPSSLLRRPTITGTVFGDWSQGRFRLDKNDIHFEWPEYKELLGVTFTRRNVFIRSVSYSVVLEESIPTRVVKSFIVNLAEEFNSTMKNFVVTEEDRKELEQVIGVIKNVSNKLQLTIDSEKPE